MAARFGFAIALTLALAGSATAQTQVFVNDNFNQYASTADFQAQWAPANGLGTVALAPSDGNYLAGITSNDPLYTSVLPDEDGVAIDHIGQLPGTTTGMVNQYGGAFDPVLGQAPAFTIKPTATQSVYLSADIFVGVSGNKRMSVGLRATLPDGSDTDALADTANLIELGSYNGAPDVLNVPGTSQTASNFAFRAQLFGGTYPNWQYFQLPSELERTTDADTIVNLGDVGAGWHRYAVTITPTSATFTIDLFRDGKRNTSRTIDPETGERPGTAGQFDGSVTVAITTSAAGFNNLRMGTPSGTTTPNNDATSVSQIHGFDNILLQLQAAAVAPGGNNADFNGDNIVDGNDFLIWQRGFSAAGTLATGDANGDLAVNDADLAIWKTQFGTDPTPAAAAVGAVPEPATLALAGMAMVAGWAAARRR